MKQKVVRVTWVDSQMPRDGGWLHADDVEDWAQAEDLEIETVGFLVFDGKTHIAVAQNIGIEYMAHPIKIPKVAIKKLRTL